MRKLIFTRKVLNLTLATMLFVFSLPGASFAQAETTTTNEFIPFLQFAFVPCANNGAGEVILISGILHIETHVSFNGNRINVKSHFQPQGATAVGLITGTVYRAVGVTQLHDTTPVIGGSASNTFINNFRQIGPGPNNNLQVHVTVHLTFNANHEVTSTVDNTRIDCN